MLNPQSLMRALRCRRLRFAGAKIKYPRQLERGINCRPGTGTQGAGQIEFGQGAWIEGGVVLHAYGGSIRVGRNAFLGPHVVIYGHGGVEIGDDCLVSMHCRILSSNHAIPPLGTTIRSQPDVLLPTKIGHDVWLGAGVTVLGGVTIGDGCIVGAGAVVANDLPPGSISHGIPAVTKKWRDGASHP